MAGNEGNPPKGLLACDLCYKRKVKCDRQNPCRNCIAAKTTCQWTRQLHVRRRKPKTADAVRTLEDRVNHLENLLQQSQRSERVTRTDRGDLPRADHDGDMEEDFPEDHPDEDILQQSPQTPTSNIPPGPLRLVDALERVREAERVFSRFRPTYRERESESLTSTDILNAMTRPSNDSTDLIPHSSVNKMGQALLSDHPIPDAEKLQYQVILLFKAALALGQQSSKPTEFLARHIKRIQIHKFRAAMAAYDKVGLSPLLSLFLLQTQCIQVIIRQFLGDVAEARHMMVVVSKTLAALGYNRIQTTDDTAVKSCVNWCYQCDRSMAVFLRQSPWLPPFDGDRGLDIPNKLLYYLQDRVLYLASQKLSTTQRALGIEKLDRDIKVHAEMQKDDTRLYFRLYATLTVLWHGHPDLASKPQIQTQLTDYARETLKLLNQLDCRLGLVSCEADITLHWDILCSGVLPMLILCVHTLRSNDADDFELLKDYTSIVSGLSSNYNKDNALATQIHQFCIALVQICEARRRTRAPPPRQDMPTNHDARRKNFLNFDSFFVAENTTSNSPGEDDDDDDNDNDNDENLDAMVAEILTLQPKIYKPSGF